MKLALFVISSFVFIYCAVLGEAALAATPYLKSNQRSCPGEWIPRNQHTILASQRPETRRYQGEFGTCSSFAAQYLLQAHYQLGLSREGSTNKPAEIAVVDVIGKGCRLHQDKGAFAFAVLHNIQKNHSNELAIEPYSADYGKVMRALPMLNAIAVSCSERAVSQCCRLLNNQVLSKPAADSLFGAAMLLEHVSTELQKKEPDTFAFRAIQYPGNHPVTLPPFNLKVLDALPADQLRQEIRKRLESAPPLPVHLSICENDAWEEPCKAHSLVVTGVRETCCESNPTSCHEEWEIVNSQDESSERQGWLQAAPLAKASSENNRYATYLEPCSKDGLSSLPPCATVQGKPLIQGNFPLHYLVSAQDHETAKELLPSLKRNDLLKKDAAGKTPLEIAISNEDEKMIQLLESHLHSHQQKQNKAPKRFSPYY